MSLRPCALLLALYSTSAAAFAPTTEGSQGIEPQRIRTYDVFVQRELASTPQWKLFTAGEGAGWQARFDQLTGTPHRMWGAGINIGATNTSSDVRKGMMAFLGRHADLLGVGVDQLAVHSANYSARFDTWYVDVDVLFEGVPVYRGGVTARIKQGQLILLGVDTYPETPRVGAVVLSEPQAIQQAIAQGPAAAAKHTDAAASLIWLPEIHEGALRLRLCWQVTSETEFPRGQWTSFVDAETGELVNYFNRVRFITGTVSGEHEIRTVDDDIITSPLPLVKVIDGDETVYTAEDGTFTTAGTGENLVSELNGSYLRVLNDDGPEGLLTFSGTEGIWNTESATQAEVHTYVFAHQIRDWSLRVAPDVSFARSRLLAKVNIDENCNAYYDGNLNFFQAGGGCRNTGRIADVVYHEWGHGFHDKSIEAGIFDGSLSEGAADTVAFLQTDDPVIAPGFMNNGGGIREVATDKVYPNDYVANDLYVHDNGLIFGGSMWDLWHNLRDEKGDELGTEIATKIFTGLLKGGSDVEGSYDEAVVADDDDGDLANHTPNYCAIIQAFAPHGLGPSSLGGGVVQVVHDPNVLALADEPTEINADLYNVAPECYGWTPAKATVTWRPANGVWQTVDLPITAESARGAIPAQVDGTYVEYYVTIQNTEGDSISAPVDGDRAPFSYYAGDVLEVFCNDFETDEGGFTHELVSGEESLGADDWQWGIPQGEGGDPDHAYSGSKVWGNDLGDGDYNGQYQDGKTNRLNTPAIATGHYQGVFLAYERWLGVEDAKFDHARILADGTEVWSNVATNNGEAHTRDRQWASAAVDLNGAGDDGSVAISWEIAADEGLSFGGWNLDDVCLYAPATPDNRLGISNFLAEDGAEDAIALTWTQPKHAPVSRVVVVRREDRFATGPTDGDIVYDAAPELGADVEVLDDDVKKRSTYYYAVYATDGENWLSWTVEGRNADIGSTVGAEDEGEKDGCGCSSSGPSAGWIAGVVGLMLLRRRRSA